jgi:hypothetical protein
MSEIDVNATIAQDMRRVPFMLVAEKTLQTSLRCG